VRQLLEMLEAVTRMESTYLTRIDINAQRQQSCSPITAAKCRSRKDFPSPGMNPCANAPLRISARLAMTLPVAGTPASPPRSWGSPPLSIPVRLADGSLFGTLCATSRQQQPYNLEGEQVMGLFAKLISHYVEKDTLVQQLQAANVALELHSSTDELTQLPNRRALFKQLALRFASARSSSRCRSFLSISTVSKPLTIGSAIRAATAFCAGRRTTHRRRAP
jgi:diguanylate cyclase